MFWSSVRAAFDCLHWQKVLQGDTALAEREARVLE